MNTNEKMNEIFNLLKEHFLYAKLSGSRCFSFISNPHDYDIIIISKDEESRAECMRLYRKTYVVRDIFKEYHLDFHFRSLNREEMLLDTPYPYLTLKTEIIYSNSDEFKSEEKPVDYLLNYESQIIKNYKEKLQSKTSKETKLNNKFWYYAYTTLCILKNKSSELSEEQIENINILHDRKEEDIEKRMELIDDIIKEIESWQN